jgi:hypothetical protein
MFRPRTLTLTLLLLALAPGCKSGSAPGAAPASGSEDRKSEERKEAATPESAAEPTAAPPPSPEPGGMQPSRDKTEDRSAGDAVAGSRLELAEPMISGGLDRDIIRRKVQDHEADIQACVAAELAGTVAVKLTIDDRGVVKDVALNEQSKLDNREAVDCILALMSKWSFVGEATGKASVDLQLELKPVQ